MCAGCSSTARLSPKTRFDKHDEFGSNMIRKAIRTGAQTRNGSWPGEERR